MTESPPTESDPAVVSMTAEEIAELTQAAEEMNAPQVLARIAEHNRAVINTVGTVGTLLAGVGGVTAAISVNRTTFEWHGIPVVPVGALITSVLAGVAVATALFGSRPEFAVLNPNNLLHVRAWFTKEIGRGKRTVQIASWCFIASAFVAAATTAVAGCLAIAEARTDPRNVAALSTTLGDKGAVSVKLSGAVEGLDEDEHLVVAVTSNAPARGTTRPLISVQVYPDNDGKAILDSSTTATVGSSQVTASMWVIVEGDTASATPSLPADFTLTAIYPKVPKPAK